ncbi:MAG: hypothetical protein WC728_13555 [Elusimicrobiota bacterium]
MAPLRCMAQDWPALSQLKAAAPKAQPVQLAAPAQPVSQETLTPVPFEELSPRTRAILLGEKKQEALIPDVIGTIGTIVSIGSTLISVIRGGEIVYNNGYAAVYPKDADWRYFTWKKQSVYSFRYKKTTAGVTVVDSVVAVSFKYDGQYQGAGRYIGNIQVVGDKCWTLLGNTLHVTAELPASSVENLAPQTPLDPLAAISLNLTYANQAMVGSGSRRESYQIRGDGKIIDFATGLEPPGGAHIDLP